MPSWCLPGRENDPVMERKAILQKSLAFSRTFNSRNLEFYWYPLWAQTLSDLVADVPNLLVAPQFPAWFVPEDDQQEDEDDGDDPEEVDMHESLDAEESAVTRDDDVGELSFASTAPEQHARGVLVDFAILKVSAEPQQRQNIRYGGWRITGANVGLFVEVKRFVSRSGELDQELHVQIAEARGDLIEQVAYLFLQDENKDSVLAIAAADNLSMSHHVCSTYLDRPSAGPYWCNTKKDIEDMTKKTASEPT
ncbi:uncharacterized protein EDB91DRAFT_895839 [Suillus paluster]|uniref:uncharacterized protein n=1 Tax=Suillus paluster TaxID=48578 RepID=UPI001B8660A9|nr:uncharacterized protein EDB91DRAFT_895839 [Suillus paluster]KAG1727176.1 hypothetical protein EDB91DRAFT_895839 [Suillus paluster]